MTPRSLPRAIVLPSATACASASPRATFHHSAAPAITETALAACAFVKPKNDRGLMRINSTKNLAAPVSTKYAANTRHPQRAASGGGACSRCCAVILSVRSHVLALVGCWLREASSHSGRPLVANLRPLVAPRVPQFVAPPSATAPTQSRTPQSIHKSASGWTRSVVGTSPFGKLIPQGREVGLP